MRFGSLPSRERGLKFPAIKWLNALMSVAPLAGAWIEMFALSETSYPNSRSPRGSVD